MRGYLARYVSGRVLSYVAIACIAAVFAWIKQA